MKHYCVEISRKYKAEHIRIRLQCSEKMVFVQTWVMFFFRTLPPVPVLEEERLVLSITMVEEDWSLVLCSLLLSSRMSLSWSGS